MKCQPVLMYYLKYPLKSIHVYAITSSKEETMIMVHSVLMFENALAFLKVQYVRLIASS